MPDPTRGAPAPDEAVLPRTEKRTRTPPRYRVLFHNDDFTTMDFVIRALVRHFQKSETEATRIMLEVHMKGVGVAGVYPRDQAETRVARVTEEAQKQGFPLLVTMEPT